ncbi:MAG: hypothetical protein JNL72_11920 [Flavipsychrobacter sp.]|nr:hypothetical protein [Flavipsychrobacter sp.]
MRKKLFRSLLLLVFAGSSLVSEAKFPGFFSHFELGFTYPMATARFEGYNPVYSITGSGDLGVSLGDTFVSRNVTSKLAYGAYIGSSIRLKRTGVASALSLHIDIVENAYVWENLYKAFSVDGSEYDLSNSVIAVGYQIGVPVSLDYKFGAGAMGSKNYRLTGSFGVGGMPAAYFMVAESAGNVGGGFSFATTPFVKAEVGVMAGICIKVRGLVSFGAVPWINESKSFFSESTGGFKVTGQTTAMFSLVIMPFSWAWKKAGWWDGDFKYD